MADLYTQADLGEMINSGRKATFIAGGAIAKGDVVKLSTHVAGEMGKVIVATNECVDVLGVALTIATADGDPVTVALRGGSGIVKVTGSGAITVGTLVCAAGAAVKAAPVAVVGDIPKGFAHALMTFADGDTGLILLS